MALRFPEREVLNVQRQKRPNGRFRIEPIDVSRAGDKIIASSQWVDENGEPQQRIFQVFTIRDERIVDWQDCRTRRAAERFATRP
jgi:hypothetical protein